jgi:hypothetical protein
VKFHLRERSLQTQNQSAVYGGRIVDAIVAGDEASAVAANVQQRVPVRTVAREAGELRGEDDADLPEGDPGAQLFEPFAMGGLRAGEAQV